MSENNDKLIDYLIKRSEIKSPSVESVFRAVQRGFYYLPEYQDDACKHGPWKIGNIHLSAPCIYGIVMENLQLKPGLSFLNVGSGTGYLSTLVGLLLGQSGVNHGIEICDEVVEYARRKLFEFKRTSSAMDLYDFCEPTFVKGNALCLRENGRRYDRVYCGAACPTDRLPFLKGLVDVGGILIVPLNGYLLRIYRTSETTWNSMTLMPAVYAALRLPSEEELTDFLDLPQVEPMSLQHMCRSVVRATIRKKMKTDFPGIRQNAKPRKRKRAGTTAAKLQEGEAIREDDLDTRKYARIEQNNQIGSCRVNVGLHSEATEESPSPKALLPETTKKSEISFSEAMRFNISSLQIPLDIKNYLNYDRGL